MLNIPRIMILLIARNMFDDVRNIRVELVHLVPLFHHLHISNQQKPQSKYLWRPIRGRSILDLQKKRHFKIGLH